MQSPKAESSWPKGLLSSGLAKVSPDIACELLYEVGWSARHRYVDVRQVQSGGFVKDAIHVPFLPEPHTFEARASAALLVPDHSVLGAANEDPKEARLIIGCHDDDAEDARSAAGVLKSAGYHNVILLEGGFKRWLREEFPCAPDECEEIPDSTL